MKKIKKRVIELDNYSYNTIDYLRNQTGLTTSEIFKQLLYYFQNVYGLYGLQEILQ